MNDSPESLDSLELGPIVDHRAFNRGERDQQRYTEEHKALALSVYAETGSADTASKETGIPRTTIIGWIERDPEIDAKLDSLRRAIREQLAHKYAIAAAESLDALIDRIRNGDYHFDREGQMTRRPIPGRELAFINSVTSDKHALLTGTMGKQRAEDAALGSLADKLIAALDRKRIEGRTVDATYPQDGAKK